MFNNVVLVGGIHGVGKSTICQQICRELNMEYLSASELLKWEKLNEDIKNKKVKNIPFTQNKLIIGLKEVLQKDKFYLLDGHFCLLNKDNEIENISSDTFKQINPIAFVLIIGNVNEVKQRLEDRDDKSYDYDLLDRFQNKEFYHAKCLAEILNLPLNIATKNDYLDILDFFQEIIKEN